LLSLLEQTMKHLRQYNWRAIAIALLVVILSFGAWQYLSTKTNQAETQRKLEAKQSELTTKLNELDSTKLNAKQLEEAKKQLEQQKAELEKQLQAKRSTPQVYAQVAPKGHTAVPVSGTCDQWIAQAGITDVASARALIMAESGCNPNSYNRAGSGACGVAQELPCGKSGCSLGDGACQVRWMNGYVLGRYGSWANAWATWNARYPHWY
jgi:hypothetical protein